jgi:hypothetical protein
VPPPQTSLEVQLLPSLQAVPLPTLDQVDVEAPGLHTWHGLPGLAAPLP